MSAPLVFETFREFDSYSSMNLTQDKPSCFNSMVRVRKYRVTVELIDEPIDVIRARIQKLWDESRNIHHAEPLLKAAKQAGFDPRDKK